MVDDINNPANRKLERPLAPTSIDSRVSSPTRIPITVPEKVNSLGVADSPVKASTLQGVSATGDIAGDLASAQRATDRLVRMPSMKTPSYLEFLQNAMTKGGVPYLNQSGQAAPGTDAEAASPMAVPVPNAVDVIQYRHASVAEQHYNFSKAFMGTYARKDLALSYQNVLLMRGLIELTQRTGVVVENKLEAIRANTASSDARKLTIADRLREGVVSKVTSSISDWAGGKITDAGSDLIMKKIVPGIKKNWNANNSLRDNLVNVAAAGVVGSRNMLQAGKQEFRTTVGDIWKKASDRQSRSRPTDSYFIIGDTASGDMVVQNGQVLDDALARNTAYELVQEIKNNGRMVTSRTVSFTWYRWHQYIMVETLATSASSGQTHRCAYITTNYKVSGEDLSMAVVDSIRKADLQPAANMSNDISDIHNRARNFAEDLATDAMTGLNRVVENAPETVQNLKKSGRALYGDFLTRVKEKSNDPSSWLDGVPPEAGDNKSDHQHLQEELSRRMSGQADPDDTAMGSNKGWLERLTSGDLGDRLKGFLKKGRSSLDEGSEFREWVKNTADSGDDLLRRLHETLRESDIAGQARDARARMSNYIDRSGIGRQANDLRDSVGEVGDQHLQKLKESFSPEEVEKLLAKFKDQYDQKAEAARQKAGEVGGKAKEAATNYIKETDTKTIAMHTVTALQLAGVIPPIPVGHMMGGAHGAGVGTIGADALKPTTDAITTFHESFNTFTEKSAEHHALYVELLKELIERAGMGGGGGGGPGPGYEPKPRGVFGKFRQLVTNSLVAKGVALGARGAWGATKLTGRYVGGTYKLMGKGVAAIFGRNDMAPLVDVYREDQLASGGEPLVTKRQFEQGLVFAKTKRPVINVRMTTSPVIDPMSGVEVITQDDIDAGLVDSTGRKITKRKKTSYAEQFGKVGLKAVGVAGKVGLAVLPTVAKTFGSIYSSIFKTAGSVITNISKFFGNATIGLLTGKTIGGVARGALGMGSAIAGLYKTMFSAGGAVIKGGVNMVGGLVSNLFGFGGRGKGGITKKDLNETIGERLDDIYDLLAAHFDTKKVVGDVDGDGDREGSYQDHLQKLKERREARANESVEKASGVIAGMRGRLGGGIAALAGMLGGGAAGKAAATTKDEEEDDSGGLVETVAGTAAGGWLASKLGVFGAKAKGAAKAVGRGIGKGIKGTGKGAWGVAKFAGKTALAAGGLGLKGAGLLGKGILKPLKSLLSSSVLKGVGKSALKKIPLLGVLAGLGFGINRAIDGDWIGAGGEVLSGLVSLVPFFGTGASLAIDGWLGYRDYKNAKDPYGMAAKERIQAYGIDDPSLFLLGKELEKDISDILNGTKSRYSYSDMASISEKFGFDPDDKDQVAFFVGWLERRVIPLAIIQHEMLVRMGKTYDDIDDMSIEEVEQMRKAFAQQSAGIVSRYGKLKPTMTAYNEFLASQDEEPETKSGAGSTTKEKKPYDIRGGAAVSAATQPPMKSLAGVTPNDPTGTPANLNVTTSTQGARPSFPTGGMNIPGAQSPIFPKGGMSSADADLGDLSSEFESGTAGSSAIGWDSRGGTSYGKYQIAVRPGTFKSFLQYLLKKGGAAAEIARKLATAGNPDGGRSGPVAETWKQIATTDPNLPENEHRFIKDTHYDVAFGKLDPELQQMISGSKTLQKLLWSSAVQHGPGGAAEMFMKNYQPGQDAVTFTRKIFQHRGTKLGLLSTREQNSVLSRYGKEEQRVLAQLREESGANDNTEENAPRTFAEAVRQGKHVDTNVVSVKGGTVDSGMSGITNAVYNVPPPVANVPPPVVATSNEPAPTPARTVSEQLSKGTESTITPPTAEELDRQRNTLVELKDLMKKRADAVDEVKGSLSAAETKAMVSELSKLNELLSTLIAEQKKDEKTGDSALDNDTMQKILKTLQEGNSAVEAQTVLMEKGLGRPTMVVAPINGSGGNGGTTFSNGGATLTTKKRA